MSSTCPREDELLDALGRGFVGPELDEHAHACQPCQELRLVAGALLDERGHAITEAAVPSAGTMLWRMRMRHRQEAETTARRSLLVGQAVTLIVALSLVATLLGAEVAGNIRSLVASIQLSPVMLLVLVAAVLAAPIGGYVAIRQK